MLIYTGSSPIARTNSKNLAFSTNARFFCVSSIQKRVYSKVSKCFFVFGTSYLMISNIVAMSSVAIVAFDFSIKMFFPVIIYDGITLISA